MDNTRTCGVIRNHIANHGPMAEKRRVAAIGIIICKIVVEDHIVGIVIGPITGIDDDDGLPRT